jgi:biotin transporter BioY
MFGFLYFIGFILASFMSYSWLSKEFRSDDDILMNLFLAIMIGTFSWVVVIISIIYVMIMNNRLKHRR